MKNLRFTNDKYSTEQLAESTFKCTANIRAVGISQYIQGSVHIFETTEKALHT